MADGYVILTLRFFQEEGQWVGDCEELGVAHYGETLDEVRTGLEDLLVLTLDTMESVGERERFFCRARHYLASVRSASAHARVSRLAGYPSRGAKAHPNWRVGHGATISACSHRPSTH